MTIRGFLVVGVLVAAGAASDGSAAAEMRSATVRTAPVQAAPATTTVTKKRLTAPPGSKRYVCETDSEGTECTCKGVLDCNALIESGDCKGQDVWEDSDDPSKGGCG